MDSTKDTPQWNQLHPERAAEQARKAYYKKIEAVPEFRKVLALRSQLRRLKLKQEKLEQGVELKPTGRPKKEKQDTEPKKIGRPLKYVWLEQPNLLASK